MQEIMKNNKSMSYFIGANAKYTSGLFVSIEGVPLANMPIKDMYESLDKEEGQCLSMSFRSLKVMSCSKPLPYFCYKKDSECGTTDPEYKHQLSTGSCYKVHKELKIWNYANTVCLSEGGYLAILNNEVEAKLISNMIPEVTVPWTQNRDWQGLYIGVHDWTHNGTWLTYDGQDFEDIFHSWDDGRPDRFSMANCAVINRRVKLDNLFCGFLVPFICEKDPKNVIESQQHSNRYIFT